MPADAVDLDLQTDTTLPEFPDVPLLTRAQERELSEVIRSGLNLLRRVASRRLKPEERETVRNVDEILQWGLSARNRMCKLLRAYPKEEQEALQQAIAAADLAKLDLADVAREVAARVREPHHSDILRLAELAVDIKGQNSARGTLASANFRLVANIAKQYRNRGMSISDLFQEGCGGLLQSVENYDANRGTRFATYATWWIKQSMRRLLADRAQTIRLGCDAHDDRIAFAQAETKLMHEQQRRVSVENVMESMGIVGDERFKIMNQQRRTISHDMELSNGAGIGWDFVADKKSLEPADDRLADSIEITERILKQTDKRYARIFRARYGLDGNGPKTLAEVGRLFRMTKERVRQIETKILDRIRRAMGVPVSA